MGLGCRYIIDSQPDEQSGCRTDDEQNDEWGFEESHPKSSAEPVFTVLLISDVVRHPPPGTTGGPKGGFSDPPSSCMVGLVVFPFSAPFS